MWVGNRGFLCVGERRNAYGILIGMSERKSEDPMAKLRCGWEVSITMDLTGVMGCGVVRWI